MNNFRIIVKQITNYGTFKDVVTVNLPDIKNVLPKKIRDKITKLSTLQEVEKVTISIESKE
ncbi:MAG: hypothetical protein E3J23_08595 [Candidatus Stahlbacteria bacterium]|nr:MAG: hypothetical protein E3J23_08595 [Candidatus Stahlbacteria bacterium]